jgi:hypothetical protein
MFRSNTGYYGFPVTKDILGSNAYLYGLSDFWAAMFEDEELVNAFLEQGSIQLSEVYSKFLQMTSALSLEEIQAHTHYQIKLLTFRESRDWVSGTTFRIPPAWVSAAYLMNRPILPTQVLEEQVGFSINAVDHTVTFAKNLADLGIPVRSVVDPATGLVVDREYGLWATDAVMDEDMVFKVYGSLVNIKRTPFRGAEAYKSLVKGLYFLYMNGPVIRNIEQGVGLCLGVPMARETEIVLQVIRNADTADYLVVTPLFTYHIPYDVPPAFSPGDTLVRGTSLLAVASVDDHTSTPGWWEGVAIPFDVIQSFKGIAYDGVSTLNQIIASKQAGALPAQKDMYYLMDHYLKNHVFLVRMIWQTAFEPEVQGDIFQIISTAKPTYTYAIRAWEIPILEEDLRLVDDRLSYGPTFCTEEHFGSGETPLDRSYYYGYWKPATAYTSGTVVVPPTDYIEDTYQIQARCSVGGTSHTSSFDWSIVAVGDEVSDGTATWVIENKDFGISSERHGAVFIRANQTFDAEAVPPPPEPVVISHMRFNETFIDEVDSVEWVQVGVDNNFSNTPVLVDGHSYTVSSPQLHDARSPAASWIQRPLALGDGDFTIEFFFRIPDYGNLNPDGFSDYWGDVYIPLFVYGPTGAGASSGPSAELSLVLIEEEGVGVRASLLAWWEDYVTPEAVNLAKNTTHHLAVVCEDDLIKVVVNGVTWSEVALPAGNVSQLRSEDCDFYLGTAGTWDNAIFTPTIQYDELRISRAAVYPLNDAFTPPSAAFEPEDLPEEDIVEDVETVFSIPAESNYPERNAAYEVSDSDMTPLYNCTEAELREKLATIGIAFGQCVPDRIALTAINGFTLYQTLFFRDYAEYQSRYAGTEAIDGYSVKPLPLPVTTGEAYRANFIPIDDVDSTEDFVIFRSYGQLFSVFWVSEDGRKHLPLRLQEVLYAYRITAGDPVLSMASAFPALQISDDGLTVYGGDKEPEYVQSGFAAAPPAPVITNAPGSGAVDEIYYFQFTVGGTATGAEWSIVDGALPNGWLLDSETGVIEGVADDTVGYYTFTVRLENVYGSFDEREFSVMLGDISCSLLSTNTQFFDAGSGFPAELLVALPPTTGSVVLQYAMGSPPDAVVVEYDDEKIVNTGFVGSPTASNQTGLDTVLTNPANDAEVLANDWVGAEIIPGDIIASTNEASTPGSTFYWGWKTWNKGTTTDHVVLKMYPGHPTNTSMGITMSCPGEPVLWTPHHLPRQPDFFLDNTSVITDVSGNASQWNRCPHFPAGSFAGQNTSNWHVYQTNAANRPQIIDTGLNGLRTIRADGSNDFMIATAAAEGANSSKDIFRNKTAGYCFFVFKRTSLSSTGLPQTIFNNMGSTNSIRFATGINAASTKIRLAVRQIDTGDLYVMLSDSNVEDTEWHIGMCVMDWSSRTGKIYIDGVLDTENTTLTPSAGPTVDTASSVYPSIFARDGSIDPGNIELAEIFAHGVLPSNDDIDRMFGYAAHKWGLTGNLPAEHPYKTSPPLLNDMNEV